MGDSLENPDTSVEAVQNVTIVDYGAFANYIRVVLFIKHRKQSTEQKNH